MDGIGGKQIITGISPEFAITKMDEDIHPEIDIFVEDDNAAIMLREILVEVERDLIFRVQIVPYGTANVGRSLGQMVSGNRFPRPTVVFLDGDQAASDGCICLPGGDAPERVVFEALKLKNWDGIAARIGRDVSKTIDACNNAMTLSDHHEWTNTAANKLVVGGNVLWQALCAQWARDCLDKTDGKHITDAIQDSTSRPRAVQSISTAQGQLW
jgi:hypothetical protein